MKTFARLVNALDSTNKTTQKLEAIERFLIEADSKDKLWLLALFTGRRPKRPVNTRLLREWAIEVTGIPEWLFLESYSSVGDLSETIALVLASPRHAIDRSLHDWMIRIATLGDQTEADKKAFVLEAWDGLATMERFIFNKLLGGSFRLGISSKSFVNALAKHYNLAASTVMHSIMGDWNMEEITFDELVRGAHTDASLSKPYPFCLAYALEKTPEELGDVADWQAEYKWDGIRGQFIKRRGEVSIWSRGEELITAQFPELADALRALPGDFVIDGEILVRNNDEVLDFALLQRRLNRKKITKKTLAELPASVYAYDLLEWDGSDWRAKPLGERRVQLEKLFRLHPSAHLHLSPVIEARNWAHLAELRSKARDINSEGLMLKHRQSAYRAGRKKGDWWKWKIAPLTIDAVLVYAQKGSGRRSGYYTDYTFAIRDGDQLVTIAKAYSGLTDQEIREVSRFVSRNALEKFGPVRTVRPELVFEIAFEGIAASARHKAGVALRFPRILRWRKDKAVDQIDDIEDVRKLIK